jgi:hypothetical protein
MTRTDFIAGLIEIGFEATAKSGTNFVVFPYEILVGRLAGTNIQLALEVVDLNPPPGPHVSPHLLPINQNAQPHPAGGVHPSPALGMEWQYWSRPFPGWAADRSARAYMAHITTLFATL